MKIKFLLEKYGTLYSKELGINLNKKDKEEVFKWFLASLLFGARISETIAKRTYKTFEKYNLLTPQKILEAGWDFLVNPIMREGGYVRYDGKTSDKILKCCQKLLKEYKGNLNNIEKQAKNSKDLERKIQEFYGVGPVTCRIFLRELRGIWKKANPEIGKTVRLSTRKLKLKSDVKSLQKYWYKHSKLFPKYDFRHFEVALLRYGKIIKRNKREELYQKQTKKTENIRIK